MQNNHSVTLYQYQDLPKFQAAKIPEVGQNEVLIEVEASTINPSDLLFIDGNYFKQPLPNPCGFEGVGKVIQAGANLKALEGRRVSFAKMTGGAWSNFVVVPKSGVFPIDDDVPVCSAASGIVNPLTAIGFVHQTKANNRVGFIHTAAASALGRMLNKLCIKEKIVLINIVRRQEQADLLKSEGAEHVVVTTGDWQSTLKNLITTLNVNTLYDALGGGDTQAEIIKLLPHNGTVYVYGSLENTPTRIHCANLIGGLTITGFYNSRYFATIPQEEQQQIIANYSSYLKNELATGTSKQFKLSEIQQALKYYKANMTQGKVLIRP